MDGKKLAIHKYMSEKPPILIGLKGEVFHGLGLSEKLYGQLQCLSAIGLILIYPVLLVDNLWRIYPQDPYGKVFVKEGVTVIGAYVPLAHPDEVFLSAIVLIRRLPRADRYITNEEKQQEKGPKGYEIFPVFDHRLAGSACLVEKFGRSTKL
jgi:hypothetical protein